MNKKQLIKAVATQLEMTQKEVGAVLEEVLVQIGERLVANEEVSIAGFGKFSTRYVPATEGVINFEGARKGETWKSEAKNVVKFTPAKALKDVVR